MPIMFLKDTYDINEIFFIPPLLIISELLRIELHLLTGQS